MTRIPNMHRFGVAALIFFTGLAFGQDQPPAPPQAPAPASGGWRKAGDQPPSVAQGAPPAQAQGDQSEPVDRSDVYAPAPNTPVPPSSQPMPMAAPQGAQASSRPPYGLPAQLTIKPGTFVQIRTNEYLASNKNQAGDLFTGTLTQPLIVDGVVVAQPGETVGGRVDEAGKDKDGVHRLKLELTSITMADGNQARVFSQLVSTRGPRTPGSIQAGTVAGTTATGAAIGAIAGWGTGAAIGAGVGALAGIAGVIATRNHAAVLPPESGVTFQITSPVTVSTLNAPQAFRYLGPGDYQGQPNLVTRSARPPAPAQCGPYGCGGQSYVGPSGPPPAYYGPSYYPGYYPGYYGGYPYYWGPSAGVVIVRPRVWRRW